jgi:hypothetical protein
MSNERPDDERIQRDPPPPPPLRARLPDEEDDPRDEEPAYRRIRRSRHDETEQAVEATDFIVPTNVNPWALISAYMGLIGFCLPIIGIPFAVLAIIFAILGLRARPSKGGTTYGKVTGNIRAWIGLVLGIFGLVGWSLFYVIMLVAR